MMVVSNFFMSKRSSRGLGLGRHKNLLGRSRPSCDISLVAWEKTSRGHSEGLAIQMY